MGRAPRTEYPVDVLIYATGFEWMATSTFNMIVGREGRTLRDKWQEGTKTFLGLHSHGFPNLFIVSGPQGGGGSFNFTNAIEEHGSGLDAQHDARQRRRVVDVKSEPEEEYAAHCRQVDELTRLCVTALRTTTDTGRLSQKPCLLWRRRVV